MAANEGQGKAGRKAAWQPMGASGQDCMVADGSAQSASSKADNSKARSRIEGAIDKYYASQKKGGAEGK